MAKESESTTHLTSVTSGHRAYESDWPLPTIDCKYGSLKATGKPLIKKKKFKWKKQEIDDFNFDMSILKHIQSSTPCQVNYGCENNIDAILNECVDKNNNTHYNSIVPQSSPPSKQNTKQPINFSRNINRKNSFDDDETWCDIFGCEQLDIHEKFLVYEGNCCQSHLRSKKKWRVKKAHRQIKTKYCSSVQNGGHNKKLFIKHLVAKKMNLQIEIFSPKVCPSPLSIRSIDKNKGLDNKDITKRPKLRSFAKIASKVPSKTKTQST